MMHPTNAINSNAIPSSSDSRFRGVSQIVRFNWPKYAIALIAIGAAVAVLASAALPRWLTWVLAAGIALSATWTISSLVVSFCVYDCSPLFKWRWIRSTLERSPRTLVNVHCGVDESTRALEQLFPAAKRAVLDIFDPAEMRERSIHRARAYALATNASPAPRSSFRKLPMDDGSVDLVTLLLAAHEIRRTDSREAFFAEVRRILSPRVGRVIVAEHLRDLANFLAFGPGFMHFHSRRTWLRAAERTGLRVEREFSITPFVRVFVLERSEP